MHTPNKVTLLYREFREIRVRSAEQDEKSKKRKRAELTSPVPASSREAEKIRAFKLLEMLIKFVKTENIRRSGEIDTFLRVEECQERNAGEVVKLHLEKLLAAEIDFIQAREKMRLAYFHLGQAYAQWIFELLPTLDALLTPKIFHREAYPIVPAHLLKLCKQSNESSVLKRLERARKFFHMESLVEVEALAECEDLTVKRMDNKFMKSLSLLA
ncbi:uncharacterized protein FA14DRAFT_175203 [Meira miltonrushii]|uniref:Uncharacterized protein n=1 Tax=Meira miltonrushii TaxID=1280837 RepID=A0A316V4U3_9BASI|nr:uncharacterized protein FA14DRAFT_175203 [Meira miltonrushii]PWN31511.1 hypothetical protein FA14DRAFT_175203 [Meira miltonrushii]